MTVVNGSKDCGNSPKNTFVQAIAVALEKGKPDPDDFSPDVVCEFGPGDTIRGQKALADAFDKRGSAAVITVSHAISHGKVGAASGETELATGELRRFCYVITFTNAKANCVASIRRYG